MIIDHPCAALRHAAVARIETHGDAFVGDVLRSYLKRPIERRAEIHLLVLMRRILRHLLSLERLHSQRQRSKVSLIDFRQFSRIFRGHERLPDILNDGVFLFRCVLRHRHHEAVSLSESLILPERIAAIFEGLAVEMSRGGHGSLLSERPVASQA